MNVNDKINTNTAGVFKASIDEALERLSFTPEGAFLLNFLVNATSLSLPIINITSSVAETVLIPNPDAGSPGEPSMILDNPETTGYNASSNTLRINFQELINKRIEDSNGMNPRADTIEETLFHELLHVLDTEYFLPNGVVDASPASPNFPSIYDHDPQDNIPDVIISATNEMLFNYNTDITPRNANDVFVIQVIEADNSPVFKKAIVDANDPLAFTTESELLERIDSMHTLRDTSFVGNSAGPVSTFFLESFVLPLLDVPTVGDGAMNLIKSTINQFLKEDTSLVSNFGFGVNDLYGGDIAIGAFGDDEIIKTQDANNILIGRGGEDNLIGSNRTDFVDGGRDNDNLTGGLGADVFSYRPGDGDDIIKDYFLLTQRDSILFIPDSNGAVISPDNITTSRDGLNLILTLSGLGNGAEITLENFFLNHLDGFPGFIKADFDGDPSVVFALNGIDGSILSTFTLFEFGQMSDSTSTTFSETFTITATFRSLTLAGNGDDFVVSNNQDQTIVLEDGNDKADAGAGEDTIYGGAGNDVLTGGAGNDFIDGGADRDTASYLSSTSGVSVTLDNDGNGTATDDGFGNTDDLRSIENLTGSHFQDSFSVSGVVGRVINGMGASDTIVYDGVTTFRDFNTNNSAGTNTTDHVFDYDTGLFDTLIDVEGVFVNNARYITPEFDTSQTITSSFFSTVTNLVYSMATAGLDISVSQQEVTDRVFDAVDTTIDVTLDDGNGVTHTLNVIDPRGSFGPNFDTSGFQAAEIVGTREDDTVTIDLENGGGSTDFSLAQPGGYALGLNLGFGDDTVTVTPGQTQTSLALRYSGGHDVYNLNTQQPRPNTIIFDEEIAPSIITDIATTTTGTEMTSVVFEVADGAFSLTLNGADLAGTQVLIGGGEYIITDTTVTFSGDASYVPTTITGTWGLDASAGTDGVDQSFYGLGGDDFFFGANGADMLDGGTGVDTLNGGAGNDTLYGRDGDDILQGQDNDDTLYGGVGNDKLTGGTGDDTLLGGTGNDIYIYSVGDGEDTIQDMEGQNILLLKGEIDPTELYYIQDGDDLIIEVTPEDLITIKDYFTQTFGVKTILTEDGARFNIDDLIAGIFPPIGDDFVLFGDEVAAGFDGNDTFTLLGSNNTAFGFDGEDIFYSNLNNHFIAGDNDVDTLDYSQEVISGDIFADMEFGFSDLYLAGELNSGDVQSSDTFENIQKLVTSVGNDQVIGSSGDDQIETGGGTDEVFAGAGNDLVIGGAEGGDTDADNYQGEAGFDTLDYSRFADGQDIVISTGAGTATGNSIGSDTFSGFESFVTGDGNDNITGSIANETFYTQSGDDIVNAGGGDDFIIAGSGAGFDTYDGGFGVDTLSYASTGLGVSVTLDNSAQGDEIGFDLISNIENVIGGNWDDTFVTNASDNVLTGGAGDDTYHMNLGDGSHDTIVEFDSNNTIVLNEFNGLSNLSVTTETNDVLLTDTVSGGSVRLKDWQLGETAQDISLVSNGVTQMITGAQVSKALRTGGTILSNIDPTASNDTVTTAENTGVVLDVLANDTDTEGDTLSILSTTNPQNGIVLESDNGLEYIPNNGFSGTDSFTYTVSDGFGGIDTATVNVTVDPAPNTAPLAVDDSFIGSEDVDLIGNVLADNGNGADSDPDGDTLSVLSEVITTAQGGSVDILANGDFTYTPATNFNGSDSFSYTLDDGNGETAIGTVNLTVNPVNDAPVANTDSVTTAEDTAVVIDVLVNDTDIENDTLSIADVGTASNGTVSHDGTNVTYTPNTDFNGADSFTYTISDGNGGVETATVNVTVDPINDAPVANGDTVMTDEDTAVVVSVLDNDTDVENDTLAITSVSVAANGTVIHDGTNVTYTPNANFNGSDSFTYTISDGNGGVDTETVNVTVNPVNDNPDAVNDSAVTDQDVATVVDVLTNDTDVENDALSVTTVGTAANGTVVHDGTSVTYTPNAGFSGADSFTYTVSDGNGGTDTATVNVTVNDTGNAAPIAVDDNVMTDEDVPLSGNVLSNDTDADDDTLTVTPDNITTSTGATVTLNGDGSFTYTPVADFNGADTFDYTVNDGNGGSDTGAVNITVNEINDLPDPKDDEFAMDYGTQLTGNVLADNGFGTDSDPEGDAITVISATVISQQGQTVNISSNGDFTYTGPANFFGFDSFTYTINDGNGGQESAVATIEIVIPEGAIQGSGDNETLIGTSSEDSIYGFAGADYIDGKGGNDVLYGGTNGGTDDVYGGAGNDVLLGEGDADNLYGEGGNDTIYGDGFGFENYINGNDNIYGGAGDDAIYGGGGNDYIGGNGGDDTLYGEDGDDLIQAGAGADMLYGGLGIDTLQGGGGNDTIYGEEGNDIIDGQAGDDTIYGGLGNDTIGGGNGIDMIFGGAGDDIIEGNGDDDIIDAGEGNNTVYGGAGDDDITAGSGNDMIEGNGGNDTINAGDGHNIIKGGAGTDTIISGSGDDTIEGNGGADIIDAGAGDNTIIGGGDDDNITTGAGNDTILGNGGNDILNAGDGNNTVTGGAGVDQITTGSGIDTIEAKGGDDIVHAGAGNDYIEGNAGNDFLDGGFGADTIYGGGGIDVFDFNDTGSVDTIGDFNLNHGEFNEGDVLDISDLIASFDPLTDTLSDWAQITDNGTDSFLSVDQDGLGTAFAMTQIAVLQGVTGLTDEDALLASGNLIA